MAVYAGSTLVQAVYHGSTAVTPQPLSRPAISWTPASIASSLHCWLDAADVPTLTFVGSGVSQWNDKSGNGRHASQSASASRPTTQFLSGMLAIRFDGADDFLSLSSPLPTADSGSLSVFALAAPILTGRGSSYAGQAGLLRQYATAGDPAGSYFLGYDFSGRLGVTHHLTAGNNAAGGVRGQTLLSSGAVDIMYWEYQTSGGSTSAARWAMRVDGGAENTETTTSTSSGWGAGNGEIGRSYTSSSYSFSGRVGEIVVTNVALAAADRERVEGYLAWKWRTEASLPAAHPYKSAPPT